jgi:hypothetical protein
LECVVNGLARHYPFAVLIVNGMLDNVLDDVFSVPRAQVLSLGPAKAAPPLSGVYEMNIALKFLLSARIHWH